MASDDEYHSSEFGTDDEYDNSIWKEQDIDLEQNVFGSFVLALGRTSALMSSTKKVQKNQCHQWSHCIFSLLLVLITLYMQVAFTVVMIPAISTDPYAAKHNGKPMVFNATTRKCDKKAQDNLFAEWRCDTENGGKVDFDISSGHPWAFYACTGGDWSWQESQIANFLDYKKPVESVWLKSLILLGGDAKGELFGMLALLLWCATIVQALRACAQFSMVVGAYEVGDVLYFQPSIALKVVVGILTVCRLVILVFLGIYGGQFLSYVDNLKDFILNSVALGFVIGIPEIFFNAFASNSEKVDIKAFSEPGEEDGPPKPKIVALVPSLIWDHSGGSSLLFGGVFYIFLHFKYFAPFVKNLIVLVAGPVCFNNTDNSIVGVQ